LVAPGAVRQTVGIHRSGAVLDGDVDRTQTGREIQIRGADRGRQIDTRARVWTVVVAIVKKRLPPARIADIEPKDEIEIGGGCDIEIARAGDRDEVGDTGEKRADR